MKLHAIILLIILVAFSSCKSEYKKMTFPSFTMEVPTSWEKIKFQGIDSEVGGFVTDKGDTMIYDLGWYSWNPFSSELQSELDQAYLEKTIGEENIIIDSLYKTIKIDKYDYTQGIIDCFNGVFFQPLNDTIKGYGIFIDSISVQESGVTSFNFISAHALTEDSWEKIQKAIATINFKSFCHDQ